MAIEDIKSVETVPVYPLIFITIGIQVFFYLVEQILNYLQLTFAAKRDRPEEIRALGFTQKEFVLSQAYSFDKLSFESISGGFQQAVKIIFHLTYLYPLLWKAIPQKISFIDSTSEFQMGFAFLIAQTVIDLTLETPFSYFKTFILEQRYGFNKTTLKTFILDIVKSTLISLVLTFFLLFGYLKVVELGGKFFYIYMQAFVLATIFLMMLIYPNFIAPLFNKYEVLEEGELKTGIEKLAVQNEFPLRKLFKVDGSTRSSHSNAYFFGFGKNKRIVLYDTLLNQLENKEIYAVLCHEMGHWKYSHTFKHLGALMLRVFVFFYLFSYVIYSDAFYTNFGYSQKSIFVGTFLFVELFTPINTAMNVFAMSMSRLYEFQADEYAHKMGYAKQLYTGLIKMFKENAGNLLPHPIYSWYHYSHPPLKERLEEITKLASKSK